jgi:hypothetical protein
MSEILTKKEEILKRLLDQGHISFTEMLLFLKDEIRNEIKKEQANPFRDLIAPKTTQPGLGIPLNIPYYGTTVDTYLNGNSTDKNEYLTTYTAPTATGMATTFGVSIFNEEIDKIK